MFILLLENKVPHFRRIPVKARPTKTFEASFFFLSVEHKKRWEGGGGWLAKNWASKRKPRTPKNRTQET